MELSFTPWNWLGRKPADHCRAAIGCICPPLPADISTTKPGRSSRLRAQAVEHPRPHAGAAGDDRAGVHERVRRVVIDLLGPHRADDADVVGDAADVREQLADLLAGLAELLEAVLRAEADQLLALQLRDLLALGERLRHRLAVHLGELGLVVEGFEVRRAAGLVEEDDALGLGREDAAD